MYVDLCLPVCSACELGTLVFSHQHQMSCVVSDVITIVYMYLRTLVYVIVSLCPTYVHILRCMYVCTYMYLYSDHKAMCSIGLYQFMNIRVHMLCVCEYLQMYVRVPVKIHIHTYMCSCKSPYAYTYVFL